ncbi:tol-pal system-associated acyl-CoA thioesterase [Alsobacter sp. R-9]
MSAPHTLSVRVYYEDTDFSGVVYHASYLRYLERGRTEFIRSLGIDQAAVFRDTGFSFVVRRMAIDWLKPARMDDVVTVATAPLALKGASMQLAQRVLRADEVLVAAEVLVAGVAAGRAARLPPGLRERLEAFAPAAKDGPAWEKSAG